MISEILYYMFQTSNFLILHFPQIWKTKCLFPLLETLEVGGLATTYLWAGRKLVIQLGYAGSKHMIV